MIMINSQHTLELMEKCLIMKEDRILRCGNNEPWGYSIMCAALGLLETHLGIKSSEAAKASSAERFVNLHYKLLAGQDPPSSQQIPPSSQQSDHARIMAQPSAYPPPPSSAEIFTRSKSVTPFPPPSQGSITQGGTIEVPGTPWWLPNPDPSVVPPVSHALSPSVGTPPNLYGLTPLLQIQPLNPEFSLETLGLNLNELWGGGGDNTWDWDQS